MRKAGLAAAALLALSACAAPGEVRHMVLRSTLTGHQAVPGPGDLDGTGTALVRIDVNTGQVCWELNARGIDPATAAHIHRGAAGSVGPPVIPLVAPGPSEHSQGCAGVARELALEMALRPFLFYVNVHNAAFPGGAIRGQLSGQTPRPVPQAAPRRR
jgi:hypothetical protein